MSTGVAPSVAFAQLRLILSSSVANGPLKPHVPMSAPSPFASDGENADHVADFLGDCRRTRQRSLIGEVGDLDLAAQLLDVVEPLLDADDQLARGSAPSARGSARASGRGSSPRRLMSSFVAVPNSFEITSVIAIAISTVISATPRCLFRGGRVLPQCARTYFAWCSS